MQKKLFYVCIPLDSSTELFILCSSCGSIKFSSPFSCIELPLEVSGLVGSSLNGEIHVVLLGCRKGSTI